MSRQSNSYSRYTKKKNKEEHLKRMEQMSKEDRTQVENWSVTILILISVVVFGLAFLFGGEEGLSCAAKWASR